MDVGEDAVDVRVGQVRQRRVGAHPAGVRAGIAITQALVVARGGQRDGPLAVAHGDDARLGAVQAFLDDDASRRIARVEIVEQRRRVGPGFEDRHALAGGQPVLLDDHARPGRRESRSRHGPPRAGRCRPSRVPSGRRPRRRPRGRTTWTIRWRLPRGRPEDRDPGLDRAHRPGRPRAAPPARRRRARWPPHGPGPRSRRASTRATSTQRTRGSSAMPALPGATTTSLTPGSPASFQASACSRPPPPTIRTRVGIDEAHAGRLGRLRIGRHARSIVWVRSGPTETSTIGTPACASMADR